MLDRRSFEDKAVRPGPNDVAEPETIKGPALVVCRRCGAETNWFASRIPVLCGCGGRVEYGREAE
jgi:hypothetical protein